MSALEHTTSRAQKESKVNRLYAHTTCSVPIHTKIRGVTVLLKQVAPDWELCYVVLGVTDTIVLDTTVLDTIVCVFANPVP